MSAARGQRLPVAEPQPAGMRRAAAVRRPARARLAWVLMAAALLAATPAMAGAAPAASMTPAATASANARLVRGAFAAWAAGTGSVFDLLHEDVVWTVAGTSPVSGTYASRQDFLDRAAQPITARLATPIVPELRDLVVQGDTVVALFDGTATARDGSAYRNTYAWHMVLEGGRIVRVTAFLDTWALEQLLQG